MAAHEAGYNQGHLSTIGAWEHIVVEVVMWVIRICILMSFVYWFGRCDFTRFLWDHQLLLIDIFHLLL